MAAQPIEQIAQDLHYVREAVEISRTAQYRSMAIPLVWAAVIAVGFTLNDFSQSSVVGIYWAVASPLAGMLSGWLGMRVERNAGLQSDRKQGWRQALHWLSIFAGIVAVIVIARSHHLEGRLVGQLITLVFGVVYFLAGLHLDERFFFPGLAAIAGSAALDYLGPYSWTIVGAVIAAALVASAFWTKGIDAQAGTNA